jgi:hypothetical protein
MLNRSLCCHSERSEESLEQFRNRCVRFARVVRDVWARRTRR